MLDYTCEWKSGELTVDYGCIVGDERIVYIKAGLGGNYLGYEEKYLRMAMRLHEKFGCSVICVSNPNDKKCSPEIDREILAEFIRRNSIERPRLYFFGNSNGCIKGLELAASGVDFERMVLVNMPLMINFHKTKRYIAAIPETEIIAVYGEKDPSYSYTPFINGRIQNLTLLLIPDADHNFTDQTDIFISLSDKLMKKETE